MVFNSFILLFLGNVIAFWAVNGITLAAFLVNEAIAAVRGATRRWVVDTGTGFRWRGGPVDLEIEDRQVVALRLKRTSQVSPGNLTSVFRCFEVWTADRQQPLCMCNRLAAADSDPLQALIARITDGLKRRTAAGLASGAVLEGEAWTLAGTDLMIKDGGQKLTIPLHQIDQAAPCDGMFGIWRHGEHQPAAHIRPSSKNAPVLFELLRDWINVRRRERRLCNW